MKTFLFRVVPVIAIAMVLFPVTVDAECKSVWLYCSRWYEYSKTNSSTGFKSGYVRIDECADTWGKCHRCDGKEYGDMSSNCQKCRDAFPIAGHNVETDLSWIVRTYDRTKNLTGGFQFCPGK